MKSRRPSASLRLPHHLRAFPATSRYLVGVSGGRDSAALLHWLTEMGYRNLIVCHLDHQLRGRFSTADARFVEELGSRYGLDVDIGRDKVAEIARKKKMSIETAGRAARYSFFAKVAKRRRCRTIFLAHHADDLVETFLINLFRGSGSIGLSGMREIAVRRIDNIDLRIVRPWLGVWRSEIDRYVSRHRLKFREDASNRDLAPLRNRIRGRIIPYLEKTIGRNIRENIWRAARITAAEKDFFETLLPGKMSGGATLAVKPLREMPVAVQRRVLHKWLSESDVPNVTFDLIERVRTLVDQASGVAKTNLPKNRHARRRAGRIFME